MAQSKNLQYTVNKFPNLLIQYIKNSYERTPKRFNKFRFLAQQRIPDKQNITDSMTSVNFFEQIRKIRKQLLQQQSLSQQINVRARIQTLDHQSNFSKFDLQKYFRRDIQHQKQIIKNRKKCTISSFIEWPNIQQIDIIQIDIKNDTLNKHIDFKIFIKREQLLSLRNINRISENIIMNFFIIMYQTNRFLPSLQIVPFNFIPYLMRTQLNLQWSQDTITGIVRKNYENASKLLPFQMFKNTYNVIPFVMQGHYSMIIIKGVPSLLKSRQGRVQIIYCSSRHIGNKYIFLALKEFIQIEIELHLSTKLRLNENNSSCIQLRLQRQVYSQDSGLYLMLYCETLLSKQSKELNSTQSVQNRDKWHLFPRILAFQMRQRIWNLYLKLYQHGQKNNQRYNKLSIISQYFDLRKAYDSKALYEYDYDKIEERQVSKLLYLINGTVQKSEEERQIYRLQYYYNKEINYYQSDV